MNAEFKEGYLTGSVKTVCQTINI